MSKKLIGIIASFALVLSLVGGSVAQAAALAPDQIAAIVALLKSFNADATTLANVTASLNGQATSGSVSTPVAGALTSNLTLGSTGAQVVTLQNILVSGGYLVMPAGSTMGTFGKVTQAAVIKYQIAKGITPAAGYVGSVTRNSLNGSASTGTTGTIATGVDLVVSLSPTSPAAGAVIAGQAAANLVEYTLTNKSASPSVVTKIVLQRGGVSADTNLSSVYLYNGAVRLTDAATVSSGKVTFNAGNGLFTVPAGSSMNLSVKADIDASSTAASNINVSLLDLTASTPDLGVYPISGALMTIVGQPSDLAKVSFATTTVTNTSVSGASVQVGTTNQTVWSSTMSLNGRFVWLKSFALKVIGSAPSNSLSNVSLYIGGVKAAVSAGADSNGIITFDLTNSPFKIDSGRQIEVRADIVNGSSRSFTVQLQNASDVQISDSNYNISVPVTLPSGATMPSHLWTINTANGGSLVVNADPLSATGNIISGASNVSLAKFNVTAYGESEKISQISVSLNKSLQNVALYVDGAQVGSTQNVTAGTAKTFNLGSAFVAPVGKLVSLEVKADLKELDGTNSSTTASTSVTVNITIPISQAQGMESSQTNTSAYGPFPGNALSVVLGGLNIAKNNSGFITTATPNTVKKIGSYVLTTTGAAEAVNVQTLSVGLTGHAIGTNGEVTNLYVKTGSVTSGVVSQPSGSNSFNVNFQVPASGSVVVDVYATLGASSSSNLSSTLQAIGSGDISFSYLTSGSAYPGQTISIGNGTITAINTITGDLFSTAQFVVGGLSASNIARYNFVATGGDTTLSELYFTVTGGIDSIVINGVTTPVSSGAATATMSTVITSGYQGKDIYVAANYSGVGSGLTATSGTPTSITLTGYKYISGGSPITATTSKASQIMTLVSAKPTLTASSGSGTDSVGPGYVTLMKINVGANTNSIKLNQIAVTVATSGTGTTVSDLELVNADTLVTVATTTVASGVFSLGTGPTNGLTISGSQTFNVKATVGGSYSGNSQVRTVISSDKTTFIWTDINGYATSTGSGVVPFPTAGGIVTY